MDKLAAWRRWWNKKAEWLSLVCFYFSSTKEDDIPTAMDEAQILVGEIENV